MTETMMLPPGDYLIIDPCYILKQSRFLPLMPEDAVGVQTDPHTGALFAWSWTATGDGVYADQDGHLYGVDTGTLACLPLAMLDAAALAGLPERDQSAGQVCCGRLVTFPTAVACVPCDETGAVRFGPITIETGPPWRDLLAGIQDEDE